MTLVRRHLAVVAALVLAVATGIALGAGPLSHESWLPRAAEPAVAPPPTPTGPSADEVAAAAAPGLYGARLEGRTVALVTTPGVDRDTVAALTAGIEAANGSVTTRWSIGEALVSPAEKTLVDTLGDQLLEQLGGRGAAADVVGYERMGQLVGTAVTSRESDGAIPGSQALTIRQSLAAAQLLGHGGEQPRRAPLVLLVLGADLDDHIVEPLAEGIAARSVGLVVAGARGADDLAVVGSSDRVTTVDGVEAALGRLAAVLALSRAATEPGGSYGASGTDGVLPLG